MTFTATDMNGNADSCTATVTVLDTTMPEISCPQDVTVECTATGGTPPGDPQLADFFAGVDSTDICDAGPVITNDAPTLFTLQDTDVLFTSTDVSGNSNSCMAAVTVVDTTMPEIECNSPATVTPPDAPISFTATAPDVCDDSIAPQITGYDCFKFTRKGKRVDKTDSCVVEFSGDTVTISDSGGVGDNITWDITATDDSGNTATKTCHVEVANPGQ